MLSYILLVVSTTSLLAQTYADESLLFSRTGISGTARTIGAGGAFGSIGADLGSIAINPAGIGLYRSSDFSVTPGLSLNRNESRFNESYTSGSANRIFFQQAGVSFTKLFDQAKRRNNFSFNSARLHAITFAINYQRQNVFDRTMFFSGYNSTGSGIKYFADYANYFQVPINVSNASIEAVLAWQAGLIDYDTSLGAYTSNVRAPLEQSGRIDLKGANDQIDIAFGGNVNDKFYFGAGVGISILTYSYNASFVEMNSFDTASLFSGYDVSTSLRSTALGVNARLGLIYRPAAWMRIGVAYQIPTFYNATESFSADIYAEFDTAFITTGATANPFRYRLRTPMKGTFSASFFLKENGFFSIDYELLNYGRSTYNFGRDYQSISNAINDEAKKTFTFGHVIRAGIEGAYKTLRVRGGYAISTTPYKKSIRVKEFAEMRHNATFGLGYRGPRFYADFAYIFGFARDEKYPYADFVLRNTSTSHTMFITLGWKMNPGGRKRATQTNPEPKDY